MCWLTSIHCQQDLITGSIATGDRQRNRSATANTSGNLDIDLIEPVITRCTARIGYGGGMTVNQYRGDRVGYLQAIVHCDRSQTSGE